MTKILALETTEKVATLAVAEDFEFLGAETCDPAMRSAQSLLPGIEQLLRAVSWRPAAVELVAVSVGPGSFTGLRVGVTAAKMLAYAVEAQVLGIDTLETIAAVGIAEVEALWAAVDAQRGQWVVRRFSRSGQGWPQPLAPPAMVDAEPWLAALPPGTVLTGPVLRKWANRLPDHVQPLPADLWVPTARHVAVLAARDYLAGRRDDLWTLVPQYSRPSAAEEKRRKGEQAR